MKVCTLPQARSVEWGSLIEQEPSFSVLQGWNWGAFKEQLGWKVARVAVEDAGRLVAGAQLLIKSLPLGLSLAYVPRGPVGNWRNPDTAKMLFTELFRLSRENGAAFLKIEPPVGADPGIESLLESSSFRQSPVTNQPKATILLDLSAGESGLLEQMRKKTRQYIHRAGREGIRVRFGSSDDLSAYSHLMQLTGRRERFASRSLKYYQAEWEFLSPDNHGILLLAYYQDQLIAARVVYRLGAHAAEFHAGSVSIPGLHANYLLVWEAIKWAVAHGCTSYDMWGIPDEITGIAEDQKLVTDRRADGLWGVYQFKRGFSHNIHSYIGAYDHVFSPGSYFLLNSALSWGKSWERIAAILDSLKFEASWQPKLNPRGGNR